MNLERELMAANYLKNSISNKLKSNGAWANWHSTARKDSLIILGSNLSVYSKVVWHFLANIARDWPSDPDCGRAAATQREIAQCTGLTLRYTNGAIAQLKLWGVISNVSRSVYKLEKLEGKQVSLKSVYTKEGKQTLANPSSTGKQTRDIGRGYEGNKIGSNPWPIKAEGILGTSNPEEQETSNQETDNEKQEVPYRSNSEYERLWLENPEGLSVEDMKLADENIWEATGMGPKGEVKGKVAVPAIEFETVKLEDLKPKEPDVLEQLGI